MKIRVGMGYDVHQLAKGSKFFLGGIKIPADFGAMGHSDADVLIHAICDALLGASNLGDIGKHFPDTSNKYENIDSKILLKEVVTLVKDKGFCIGNLDSTICLQSPKIADYIPAMKEALSNAMELDIDDISIKATTTEKLGFVGEGKGISAYAVVLIQSI